MPFWLRCFGAKLDSNSGNGGQKLATSTTPSQKHAAVATLSTGSAPARPNQPASTPEVAVKVIQPEVSDAEQNGHAGNYGVVQVMAADEGDRPAVDCQIPCRVSLGSPLLLFNTPSVAAHHSLTLKLQGAARSGSSAPAVDNWFALSSIADGRGTTDSPERTTACSNHSQLRQQGIRNDASVASAACTSPVSKPVHVLSRKPDDHSQAQQTEPQAPRQSQPLPNAQPVSFSGSEAQSHVRHLPSRMPPVLEGSADNLRTSPSRWSVSSSNPGGSRRQTCIMGGGCNPAGSHIVGPQASRPLPAEELAALVSTLARVRGHWLEALHTVTALAAELLGADSLSVYLLTDSGGTHAALACHGDAGGAIRLGMPLPAVQLPGHKPTALQRLYQTGEPQRGSVWSIPAAASTMGSQVPAANSGPLPAHITSGPFYHQGCNIQGHPRGAPAPQRVQDHHNHQQENAPIQHQSLPKNHSQNQQQQQQAVLPPDWQAMRVLGGMTDFVAVPLLRGDLVIGALQVVDNCTPPEDITGAVPISRRCRGIAELSVVATFISTLLVDHEVLCLMGALEAVSSAQDVDGLVRAIARHVGLFSRMRKHITPGVRVALVRGDAAALALFLDEGATAAAAAAAAGNLATGVAPGSATPVGVLSTAISRHSTACNLWQATSTAGGGGALSSGACTPDPRHAPSPGASTSGMAAGHGLAAAGRASQLGGGASMAGRCVVPLYSPSMGTCDPSSLLDTEQSLQAAASVGGVTGVAGPRSQAPASASVLVQPEVGAATGAEDAREILHVHGNTSACGFEGGGGGGDRLSGMAMSTAGDLWPWFASTTSRAKGMDCDKGKDGRIMTPAAASVTERRTVDGPEAVMARCAALACLPSAMSDESMLMAYGREHASMVDELAAPGSDDLVTTDTNTSGPRVIPICGPSLDMVGVEEVVMDGADMDDAQLKETDTEPSLGHGPPATVIAEAAAVPGTLVVEGVDVDVAATAVVHEAAVAGSVPTAAAPASASGLISLPSTLLPVPNTNGAAIAQTRLGAIPGGLYGRALALAGEDSTTPGRGLGQVQGHAMLTRGTVLAEALAAGTGMYISDVAIYMQDGRNKSRDVFLAPSGRGGPAQPTNSIAVTTISHAGLPLVGIYLTYGTPLPASLLNALISKVHAFGAMLGPLLHERLMSGDSELADEWRYLLGEVLDPQAIQTAADEQRSRRSSAAPYNQQQQHQQQHQQLLAQAPPPLTAPPSPLQIITGVVATQSSRRQGKGPHDSTVGTIGFNRADVTEAPLACAGENPGRRRCGGHGEKACRIRASASRGPRPCDFSRRGGPMAGPCRVVPAVGAPPLLRRSQTADSWSLAPSPASSRAYPSADGSDMASRSFVKSRCMGSLRASVTAEAAARAVAACASEPAPSAMATTVTAAGEYRNTCTAVLASGCRDAATAANPSLLRYDRATSNRMPLAPPPSPPSPKLTAPSAAAGLPPQGPGFSWRGAPPASVLNGHVSGRRAPAAAAPGWSASTHPYPPPLQSQHQQQQQNQQQQRQRAPMLSPLCSPSLQQQQQQRQQFSNRRLLNCSWRGPTTNGLLPGSYSALASPSGGVGPTAALLAADLVTKLEKSASEGISTGAGSHTLYLRNGSVAGRNVDSATLSEHRVGQCGSSISSGVAIVSRSTSGALGPAIAGSPAPSLLQGCSGAPVGLQTAMSLTASAMAVMEGASGVPSLGGALLPGPVYAEGLPVSAGRRSDVGLAADAAASSHGTGAEGGGGRCDGGGKAALTRSVRVQLPRDPSLKVAQSSPSAPGVSFTCSEQEVMLFQVREDRRSPSIPQAALPSPQHQHQQLPPPMNPFAAGCPASPPSTLQQPQSPAAAEALALETGGSEGGGERNISPQLLHPVLPLLPLPLPPAVAATCSPFVAPASQVPTISGAAAGVMSMSQLELSGSPLTPPTYLAAASSVGGHGVGTSLPSRGPPLMANATGSSARGSASSHNADLELSMQAWDLYTDASRRSSAAHGPRNSPAGTIFGPANLSASQVPGCSEAPAMVGPVRFVQPRPYPPIPSPLSPGRHFPGSGTAALPAGRPPSTRRCSAGGMAPASPQPPPPPPRVGAGLSRLTTVATAAGVAGGGAGAGATAGGAGPPLFSDGTSRTPHGSGFPVNLAGGGAAAVGGGPPGSLSSAKAPSPIVQRLRSSVRRNTSFNIMADPGVQDTGKVAPLMANLQDKLRSLQAEQVLARLHNKDASGADELSGLTILEPLGSGGFGTVFRGIFNGIEVAVKVLCERGAGGRSEAATMREAFELAVMTTISHPHIVQVLSAFTDVILTSKPNPAGGPGSTTTAVLPRSPATEELGEPTVVIAMEYCDAGSLADAVSAGRFRQRILGGYGALQPCMPAIYATLLEIALALRHMHAMLLVHCDLKPANILLKSNMRDPRGFSAKLSDFGLVKMVVEDGTGGGGGVIGRDARTGTITHMAPELIRATEASKMDASVDIYAFGVLMWEMISTGPVYLGMRSEEIRRGVVDGVLRPEFPPWSDGKYRALAEACLSTDPRARPTSAELVARLRTLLTESGALQDTIMRRPCKNSAFPTGANIHGGGGAAAGSAGGGGGGFAAAGGFPGQYTAAAAGAMLGIGPTDFCRPSHLMVAQPPPPPFYPLAAGGGSPHSRRGRSRSCSGNDSSTFPLHIL